MEFLSAAGARGTTGHSVQSKQVLGMRRPRKDLNSHSEVLQERTYGSRGNPDPPSNAYSVQREEFRGLRVARTSFIFLGHAMGPVQDLTVILQRRQTLSTARRHSLSELFQLLHSFVCATVNEEERGPSQRETTAVISFTSSSSFLSVTSPGSLESSIGGSTLGEEEKAALASSELTYGKASISNGI